MEFSLSKILFLVSVTVNAQTGDFLRTSLDTLPSLPSTTSANALANDIRQLHENYLVITVRSQIASSCQNPITAAPNAIFC